MYPFAYVALGDSITKGSNVPYRNRYPTVLAEMIEGHVGRPVFFSNLGKRGLTSTGLLKLMQHASVLRLMSDADLVTVCIGGDDLIYAYVRWRHSGNSYYLDRALAKFEHNFATICYTLAKLHRSVVVGTFYNPFPNTPLARELVGICNEGIIRQIASRYNFPVADLYMAFQGREAQLISYYRNGVLEEYRPFTLKQPIHPNARGYRVIADIFASSTPFFRP